MCYTDFIMSLGVLRHGAKRNSDINDIIKSSVQGIIEFVINKIHNKPCNVVC